MKKHKFCKVVLYAEKAFQAAFSAFATRGDRRVRSYYEFQSTLRRVTAARQRVSSQAHSVTACQTTVCVKNARHASTRQSRGKEQMTHMYLQTVAVEYLFPPWHTSPANMEQDQRQIEESIDLSLNCLLQ